MRILLVEDDAMLGESLLRALNNAGHAADWLRDGDSANSTLMSTTFEMVLLDLGLPKQSGLSVLKKIRDRGNHVPVIILTARDAVVDRVAGLDAGADDYLVKPFALDELEARIRAVERRNIVAHTTLLKCGHLTLNPLTYEIRFHDKAVLLPAREYQILKILIRRPGTIVSRDSIEQQLYGGDEDVDSNAVEVHIHRLRQKLDKKIIRTVRGLGYQMVDEDVNA
ncbi:MAG: hypothetical protein JWM78_3707 [Verrucomicrobiaceae bacterium]|nr:hypothetical protein [Verrucomicrobiaceae bacterium]